MTEASDLTAEVEQRQRIELERVRAERDHAILQLLQLEQEVAAHVCAADSPSIPAG